MTTERWTEWSADSIIASALERDAKFGTVAQVDSASCYVPAQIRSRGKYEERVPIV
jgi:hypothetical protein